MAKYALILAGLFCLGTAGAASAGTSISTLAVSATVDSGCTVGATTVAFGNYVTSAASPVDATGSIAVNCTNGTAYSIGLNPGVASDSTVAVRKMVGGSNALNYSLYQDASHTTTWGNTVGTDTVNGTYSSSQAPLQVYGRIAGGQPIAAGAYSDIVTVTVTY